MKLRLFILLFCFVSIPSFCLAQEGSPYDMLIEVQLHQTGSIAKTGINHPLNKSSELEFILGATIFDHSSLGIQQLERGSGLGLGFGYKRSIRASSDELRYGIRNEIWLKRVYWENLMNGEIESGFTRVLAIQPTILIGYEFKIKKHLHLFPSLAAGIEANTIIKGVPVKQGFIGLAGVAIILQK